MDESVEQAIRQALGRGDKGILQIAGEMGVGVSVVQRVANDQRTNGKQFAVPPLPLPGETGRLGNCGTRKI